jgi:ABC-2 type transport system permease protein
MTSATAIAEPLVTEAAPVPRSAPGWLVMWRVELTKLAAMLRVRAIFVACLVAPVLFVIAVKTSTFAPGDTIFGAYIHQSGFAFSLVLLNWIGLWALPMAISIVAGDICSEEHRLGTWSTLLTRSCSRSQVLVGKMLASAAYAIGITLLVALSTTIVGLVAIGHQPLVGLSGSLLSSRAALLATLGSWLSVLAPVLAITGIALLSSVLSRNSWIGVLVPVGLILVLNLATLLSTVDAVRPFLPTTGLEAWHGLVRANVYTDQIWISVLVNLAWTILSFGLAAVVFLRRDVVDS